MSANDKGNVICEGDRCYLVESKNSKIDAEERPASGLQSPVPSALVALLGDSLLSAEGLIPTASVSGPNSVIALYFSAHWCPPCRGFTPKLAEFYKQFKTTHARKDDFNVVFISSDRDATSFNEYFKEMPWLALPFQDRDLKMKLSSKFKVQGIPSLILLNGATGEVINRNGRNAIMDDPQGADFPWRPKTFAEFMQGAELVNKVGELFKAEEVLEGKVKLVYFSAHWCPPCRQFTPELVKTYNALKAASKKFETIFVSSDRDEDSFKQYLEEMPWLALNYADRALKEKLSAAFEVDGIPTLVILDEENKVITRNGRGAVDADPEGAEFPWPAKPFNLLSGASVDCLNEGPVMVMVLDDSNLISAKLKAKEVLEEVSSAAHAASAADKQEAVSFVFGLTGDELMRRVLAFAGCNHEAGNGDKLILLDVPCQVVYKCEEPSSITAAVAVKFLQDFLSGSLTKVALSDQ